VKTDNIDNKFVGVARKKGRTTANLIAFGKPKYLMYRTSTVIDVI